MHWHAKPTIEKTPKNITIYRGTNDIRKDADPADIINLSKSVSEGSGSIVIISGLVPRKAYLNVKVRYETICYVITAEVVCKLPKDNEVDGFTDVGLLCKKHIKNLFFGHPSINWLRNKKKYRVSNKKSFWHLFVQWNKNWF